MRKMILVLLLINTLIKAATLEEKMDLVDKYLCTYEKYYCSKDTTARAYHNLFIKYQKQFFNNKLQTTDGLDLPQNINDAFNTLNFFEYNHFPKYKLSETLLPILKMHEIKKMYYFYKKELALLNEAETGYKLPYNIKSIISKVNQENYSILVYYLNNKKNIYWEHKATFKELSNYLYQGGLDLVDITNASWEISLATFLKGAKYAKKVIKAKKTIEALNEIKGYGTAAYKFMNLVKDVDNLKVENQLNTIKIIGDIIDMLNDANQGGTSSSRIAKILIDMVLQKQQYEAFHTLIEYYKDSPIEGQLVLSRNHLYNRIILSLSSLINEVFEITGLSEVEGIGDAVAVTNALIQAFGSSEGIYNSQMSKTSISDKYLKAMITKELFIFNNWIITKYNALYPYAKFKLNNINNFYAKRQDELNIYLAGFNFEDTDRVDKHVKLGDFYQAATAIDSIYDIKEDIDYIYNNNNANKKVSVKKAIELLDNLANASFKKLNRSYSALYLSRKIFPMGKETLNKINKQRYNKFTKNLNKKPDQYIYRQFVQMQGFSLAKNENDLKNLNQGLSGYKAINLLYNYKKTIEFYKEEAKNENN